MQRERRVHVIYAHPYPKRSRANRALLDGVRDLPGLTVSSLYDRYPDFGIDVAREQAEANDADVLVWQSPFYWYGVPSLVHLWFEKVLVHGWAYGTEVNALRGKPLLWVTTTGTFAEDYRPEAMHGHTFEAFVPPIEQTARFCGLEWQPPLVMHGAHRMSVPELAAEAASYRARLVALLDKAGQDRDPG